MDKEKCGHCGEYGFQDGYSHPQRICRISGCIDANDCSNMLKEKIAGKGKDYIMSIFQNKEKGIQAKENEIKVREFEEKEKLRIGREKMEADEKAKKEADEKATKDAEELTAKEKKDTEEKAAKELKDAEDLKARAVKVGLPETATLTEVEAKEVKPPEKTEPDKCATCGQVIPEKKEEPAKKEEPTIIDVAPLDKEGNPVKTEEKKE